MRKLILLTLLLALSAVVASAGTYKKQNGVIILTDKNYAAARAEFPKLFIKYYATWCHHCKKLAPKWEKLSQEYAQNDSGVVFAKMDAEKHPDTSNEEGVSI